MSQGHMNRKDLLLLFGWDTDVERRRAMQDLEDSKRDNGHHSDVGAEEKRRRKSIRVDLMDSSMQDEVERDLGYFFRRSRSCAFLYDSSSMLVALQDVKDDPEAGSWAEVMRPIINYRTPPQTTNQKQ